MSIIATAPGKVVVLGEYAVLTGAPAIVMAVDRRVRVEISKNNQSYHRVSAPGWHEPWSEFGIGPQGNIKWRSNDPGLKRAYSLLIHVIDWLVAEGKLEAKDLPAGFDLILDTQSFFQQPQLKLGIGSSAALLVCLASAVAELTEIELKPADLYAMHKDLQQGQGSGLDVATSIHGGVMSFQEGEVKPAKWPALHFLMVYTGKSAVTKDFIQKFEEQRNQHPQLINQLQEAAKLGEIALMKADAKEFLDSIAVYSELLQQLGNTFNMNIFSEEHLAILKLAKSAEIVYKTSGAGGGDIGMAFSLNPDRLAYLRGMLENCGISTLDITLANQGLDLTLE